MVEAQHDRASCSVSISRIVEMQYACLQKRYKKKFTVR